LLSCEFLSYSPDTHIHHLERVLSRTGRRVQEITVAHLRHLFTFVSWSCLTSQARWQDHGEEFAVASPPRVQVNASATTASTSVRTRKRRVLDTSELLSIFKPSSSFTSVRRDGLRQTSVVASDQPSQDRSKLGDRTSSELLALNSCGDSSVNPSDRLDARCLRFTNRRAQGRCLEIERERSRNMFWHGSWPVRYSRN
jgi:hypothetical protein